MRPRIIYYSLLIIGLSILTFSACKKKVEQDIIPEQADLEVLKNSNWNIATKNSLKKLEGVLGGGVVTLSFAPQKEGELRWYYMHKTMSSYTDQTELILHANGSVNKNDLPLYGGDIKTIYNNDVWTVSQSFDNAKGFFYHKNNQPIDIHSGHSGKYPNMDLLQTSEDGLLVRPKSGSQIGHYSYQTNTWKNNTFNGIHFSMFRYNGLTHSVVFYGGGSNDRIMLLVESNNKVEKQDYELPWLKHVYYPMDTLKIISLSNSGRVLHSARYNDVVYVVLDRVDNNMNQFAVYKINLGDLSAEFLYKINKDTPLNYYDYDFLYNLQNVEVDNEGNLYFIEHRVANNTGYYGIRKYFASGGDELILKENDLEDNSRIEAIKFFNGKLHAALTCKETLSDNATSIYHFEIIYPK